MGYIGAFAVILAVFMIWREYSGFLESELCWCRAFLDALMDMREKMRCYLDSPRVWAEGYCAKALEECGFLKALRDGMSITEAYGLARTGACFSESTDAVLTDCFARLGGGYLDTELEMLGSAIDKLGKEERLRTEELPRKKKVAGAVLGACASGIVILVI